MDEVRTAEQDAGGLPFTDAARRLLAAQALSQQGLTEEGALEQVQRSGVATS